MLHDQDQPASLPPPPVPGANTALLLDFDGTLVELADRPDLVRVEPDLRNLIGRLAERLDGRIALVSGRAASEIRRLFGDVAAGIGGSHGIEIERIDGTRDAVKPPAALDTVAVAFKALVMRAPGTLIERKPYGVAFHYRAAPGLAAEAAALAERLAGKTGLLVQPGKMMVELRLGGIDKGHAVRAFMAAPPMTGSVPVFVGDDLTDEPAFAAAAAMGGAGVLVGDRRNTSATYRLANVAATLGWLERIAGGERRAA